MIAFFYNLFIAVFTGTWQDVSFSNVNQFATNLWNSLTNFVLNALGGNFDSLQNFQWSLPNPIQITSMILAFTICIGSCFVTWKIIKGILRIFFVGWGN